LLRGDVVAVDIRVEESNLDSIMVEQRASKGDLGEDHLQVFDTFSSLLKLHRTAVIAEDDDVEQGNLDEVGRELEREFPSGGQGLQSAALDDSLSNLVEGLGRGIERLEVLL
jgi:hypothetical protein